jgi:hypothetical protein
MDSAMRLAPRAPHLVPTSAITVRIAAHLPVIELCSPGGQPPSRGPLNSASLARSSPMMWALMDSDSEEAMPAATWASIVNSLWMLLRRSTTLWTSVLSARSEGSRRRPDGPSYAAPLRPSPLVRRPIVEH